MNQQTANLAQRRLQIHEVKNDVFPNDIGGRVQDHEHRNAALAQPIEQAAQCRQHVKYQVELDHDGVEIGRHHLLFQLIERVEPALNPATPHEGFVLAQHLDVLVGEHDQLLGLNAAGEGLSVSGDAAAAVPGADQADLRQMKTSRRVVSYGGEGRR